MIGFNKSKSSGAAFHKSGAILVQGRAVVLPGMFDKFSMRVLSMRLAIVFMLWVSFFNCSVAFENEPDGFRGIKWGTNIAVQKKQMQLKDSFRDITEFIRKNDKMKISGVPLKSIIYRYWKGKFYEVEINTIEADEFRESRLLKELFRRFGQSEKYSHYKSHDWMGNKSHIDVYCREQLGPKKCIHVCTLRVRSVKISEEIEKHEKRTDF